jgi:hypothetical protein
MRTAVAPECGYESGSQRSFSPPRIRSAPENAGIESIDENGGRARVRLRKQCQKKSETVQTAGTRRAWAFLYSWIAGKKRIDKVASGSYQAGCVQSV